MLCTSGLYRTTCSAARQKFDVWQRFCPRCTNFPTLLISLCIKCNGDGLQDRQQRFQAQTDTNVYAINSKSNELRQQLLKALDEAQAHTRAQLDGVRTSAQALTAKVIMVGRQCFSGRLLDPPQLIELSALGVLSGGMQLEHHTLHPTQQNCAFLRGQQSPQYS